MYVDNSKTNGPSKSNDYCFGKKYSLTPTIIENLTDLSESIRIPSSVIMFAVIRMCLI